MTPTQVWWLSALSMAGVTLLLRLAPLLLPKTWLQSHSLRALNFALPLSVMVILILASLSLDVSATGGRLLAAQVLSLLAVLAVYRLWRNVLLSMVVGVAALNACLWLFSRL